MLRYDKVIQKVIKRFAFNQPTDTKFDLEGECWCVLLEYARSVHGERDAYRKCRDVVQKYLHRKNSTKHKDRVSAESISISDPDFFRKFERETATESNIVQKLDAEIVLRELRYLGWWYQTIIEQHFLYGKSAAEIQEIFFPKRSVSWVERSMKKGLQEIRNKLKIGG